MKTLLLTTIAAGGILLGPAVADAKPRNEKQREELNQATVTLKELAVRDSGHIVTTELGNAEAWLKEAESFAKKRRTRDDFRRAVDRVNAAIGLVEARLDAADAQAKADGATTALAETEAELRSAQLEHEALTKKRSELEGAVAR